NSQFDLGGRRMATRFVPVSQPIGRLRHRRDMHDDRPSDPRAEGGVRLVRQGLLGHPWLGIGVSIVTRRDDVSMVPGRFGWDGGYGTSRASDPAEDMVAILMTQRAGFPGTSGTYVDFWTLAYHAIDD